MFKRPKPEQEGLGVSDFEHLKLFRNSDFVLRAYHSRSELPEAQGFLIDDEVVVPTSYKKYGADPSGIRPRFSLPDESSSPRRSAHFLLRF